MNNKDHKTEKDRTIERCRSEWNQDKKLQAEFGTFDSYLGYTKGVATGRVQLHGGSGSSVRPGGVPEGKSTTGQPTPGPIFSNKAPAEDVQADSASAPPILQAPPPALPIWTAGLCNVEGRGFRATHEWTWKLRSDIRSHYKTFDQFFAAITSAQIEANGRREKA